MIVGNGLVAKALSGIDRDNVVLFASGVADSFCDDESQFERERCLLERYVHLNKVLVYFSTCSVSGHQSPYFIHKKSMEDIARTANEHRIIRLPPIVNSSKGLFRFLSDHIKDGIEFPIYRHALRRTITTGDIAYRVPAIVNESNGTYDIASSEELPVWNIVPVFERLYGKRAKTIVIDAGNKFIVNSSHLVGIKGYISSAIERHYSQ